MWGHALSIRSLTREHAVLCRGTRYSYLFLSFLPGLLVASDYKSKKTPNYWGVAVKSDGWMGTRIHHQTDVSSRFSHECGNKRC